MAAIIAFAAAPGAKKANRTPAAASPGLDFAGSGRNKYRLFDRKDDATAAPNDTAAVGASADTSEEFALSSRSDRAATRGGVPDGEYDCKLWSGSNYVSLGTVRAAAGSLDTGFLAKVGATFTGAEATAEGLTISYTTARGNRESMDCSRLP